MTMSAHAVLSSPNDGAWWRELQRTLGRASDMFIVLLTQTIKTRVFFNGRFIIGNDYVRMYVTLVDSSWVVVASVLTGNSQ